MKAKDFDNIWWGHRWEAVFTENEFKEGEDCLRLYNDEDEKDEIIVFVRDEGENLVVEWSSENQKEIVQIITITPEENKTKKVIFDIIIEVLDSQRG